MPTNLYDITVKRTHEGVVLWCNVCDEIIKDVEDDLLPDIVEDAAAHAHRGGAK